MSEPLPIDDRNCYNCANSDLCYLRHDVDVAVSGGLKMLNIDGNKAPRGFTAVFEALAMACMRFERRKEKP